MHLLYLFVFALFLVPDARAQSLDLTAGGYGLSIGDAREVNGVRLNFRDRRLRRVNGLNATLWKPYDPVRGVVHGVAIGLPMTGARRIEGAGLGLFGVSVRQSAHGVVLGGLGAGAGEDVVGISAGGLGIGAGRDIIGIMVGGLGAASGRDMAGVAVAGLGVGGGRHARGILIGGLGAGADGNLKGVVVGGLGIGAGAA